MIIQLLVIYRSAQEIKDHLDGLPNYGQFEEPRAEDMSGFRLQGRIVEITNPVQREIVGSVEGSRKSFFARLKKEDGILKTDYIELRRYSCTCAQCLNGQFCDSGWIRKRFQQ